ncbi:hypothetical protein P170DRAFT_463197 [Aspergillus steynii IBT 23096]|uniref:Uncharacterized protein n=1 Tax=Aspergillus steynii IBT 23096 TaxID=1392250 RepID=A0A2I2GKX6_9EURO|nr:uncharacterized protein P170DRAFT_463197 [Aspergillus steynii IBT 23096]PLB53542.1 hypothetical protein P170DRAFT_463197 [Aspergillus steynii IBT 23096]
MAEVKFPTDDCPELESYVARLLDEAGVPNFIWGEAIISILGVPTQITSSSWAIPDSLIDTAAKVLDDAKFPPCTQGREHCRVFNSMSTHPYPDYHWHTDHRYPTEPPTFTTGVFLYRKSRLFWTFPEPPIGRPPPGDRFYMLTSDPRIRRLNPISRGPQSADPAVYPVKMPTPARYTEAMLLLTLRDLVGTHALMHWEIESGYMLGWDDQKDGDRNLDVDELDEPFREWAKIMLDAQYGERIGDVVAYRWRHRTYVEMKRKNLLPPPEGPLNTFIWRPLEDRLRECDLPVDLA